MPFIPESKPVDELGLETFPRYREGTSIYVSPDGTRHEYEGTTFPASEKTQAEIDFGGDVGVKRLLLRYAPIEKL